MSFDRKSMSAGDNVSGRNHSSGKLQHPLLDRVADADMLWHNGRREGAFLLILTSFAAAGRLAFPRVKHDRENFVKFMKSFHSWTIKVEFRGNSIDADHLFYKWMRCELVHQGQLPIDLRIDNTFTNDPNSCALRAGGAPEYTLLVSPGWYWFFRRCILEVVGKSMDTNPH